MANFRIALTGGIASGKSYVLARFAALGAPVIDADRVARQVVEPGQPAQAALRDRFGPEVFDSQGRLDRPRLAALVFDDAAARADLEAIVHCAGNAEPNPQRPSPTGVVAGLVSCRGHPFTITGGLELVPAGFRPPAPLHSQVRDNLPAGVHSARFTGRFLEVIAEPRCQGRTGRS